MKHGILWGWLAVLLVSCDLSALRAADDDPIQQAIDRGVEHLKSVQQADGMWAHSGEIGATALGGLTLLECEVSAKDPSVQKAASAVRKAGVDLSHTYSLALAIMFLDRLGEPGDVALIESMTLRLLAGQTESGGWSYSCPTPLAKESESLKDYLKGKPMSESTSPTKPKSAKPADKRKPSKEMKDRLERMKPFGGLAGGDNSNTQFATLALWVARRHGLPVEQALLRVDSRYRTSQNGDGGWGYVPARGVGSSSSSMTCAGLLGLAVGHGAITALRTDAAIAKKLPPARDPGKDPAVRAGLMILSTAIGYPTPRPKGKKNARPKAPAEDMHMHIDNYFLWSLERVAVAYGLKTIGKKDWYAWGAELLLAKQEANGGWPGGRAGSGVNTCFALLFLRRANLTKDLSETLKGKLQDPGEIELKSGGIGAEGLKVVGLQSGVNPDDKPQEGGAKVNSANDGDLVHPLLTVGDAKMDAQIADLTANLVKAPAKQQAEMIVTYKEEKGIVYTQALASAIYRLVGASKTSARDALVERLVRMKAETLRSRLQDEAAEIRAAAALACGTKEDKTHIPDLITLLDDRDPRVGRAALVSLKSLTGKDFGPAKNAGPDERATASKAWKSWWEKQKGDR